MAETEQVSRRFPTPQSLETYGRHLTNFLEWCDARGKGWQKLEYKKDLVDGYQRQMLSGAWAATGAELSKKPGVQPRG
jgi:hypothetical protein